MISQFVNEDYLAHARKLTKEEIERKLSRVTDKLPRRLDELEVTQLELIAIQLEIEDSHLEEWRKQMHRISSTS